MFKELKDCNIGDKVILWCIGWRAWDDVVVEVVSIELPFRVNVKYIGEKYVHLYHQQNVRLCRLRMAYND
jgi:hypothetical protein